MNAHIKHQIIKAQNGQPAFVVVPYDEYLALIDSNADDDLEIPHEIVRAEVRGESVIKAWREYLGLTQEELATRMKISQPSLARMESPDRKPRKETLRKVAVALGIEFGQIDL